MNKRPQPEAETDASIPGCRRSQGLIELLRGAIVFSTVSRAYTSPEPPSSAREGTTVEARIRVRLTPRAAHDAIAGWKDDVLRVRVTAPPVEGKANAALERLVAKALGLPKSAVRVASGERGRDKTLAIDGLTSEEAQARLSGAPAS